jgi:hypothetical protein
MFLTGHIGTDTARNHLLVVIVRPEELKPRFQYFHFLHLVDQDPTVEISHLEF